MQRDLRQPVAVVVAPPGLRLEPWIDPRIDEALWHSSVSLRQWQGHMGESFDAFMNRGVGP